MYGNLQEIDLSSLLYLIKNSQKSGTLLIETEPTDIADNKPNYYFIFFELGKIIYAGDKHSFNLQRLQNHLYFYNGASSLEIINPEIKKHLSFLEYESILILYQKHILSPTQIHIIISRLIQEVLFQILSLKKGSFIWQNDYHLQPTIIKFDVDILLPQVINNLKGWSEFSDYVKNPLQCPIVSDYEKLRKYLTSESSQKLVNLLDGKTSFLELSRYLNQEVSLIAQVIFPWLKIGLVKIINPLQLEDLKPSLQSYFVKTICLTEDYIWASDLNNAIRDKDKYNIMFTGQFSESLEYILLLKPDLIIFSLESDMINDVNFCRIIKNIKYLRDIPIISAVNNYNFEDYIKAKCAGISEYLAKNIVAKDFLKILKKYSKNKSEGYS